MKRKKTKKKVVNNAPHDISICNNTFTGVHWDKATLEIVDKVASGLLALAKLFQAQDVRVGSMLKIGSGQEGIKMGGCCEDDSNL